MTKFMTRAFLIAAMCASAASSAGVINGRINTIDGDKDGRVDDAKIARVKFTVTKNTTVFFDSLVLESTGVDLNRDGFITGFDNYMMLLDGNTLLRANDDSNATFGDGSVHPYDSTLSYNFTKAGTYMVTLGMLSYDVASAVQGFQVNRAFNPYYGNQFGAWRLTMTASTGKIANMHEVGVEPSRDVPEPASMALMGLGLLGVAVARRKSQKAA